MARCRPGRTSRRSPTCSRTCCREACDRGPARWLPGTDRTAATATASELLPLDRCRRLAAHVVGDAVDAAHLVDDAAGDLLEERVRQFGPIGRHEVAGLHGAQCDDVVIGAAVAHDT